MSSPGPTTIEVEFFNAAPGVPVDWSKRPDLLVTCGHCGVALPFRNRQKHLGWHTVVEQHPPSNEWSFYDTRQRFVIKETD